MNSSQSGRLDQVAGLVRQELHKLSFGTFDLARKAYYRQVFGRKVPWSGRFARAVSAWETSHQKGDAPQDRSFWDAQYASGAWKHLFDLEEISRYAVIVGYISYLKPDGSFLDVGCGQGVLLERFRPYGYRRYVGLDLSAEAIAKLLPAQTEKTAFFLGDGETFQPSESFDAIIFNECLYYFRDPFAVLDRYSKFLLPDGIIVMSAFAGSTRALAILRHARSRFKLLGETRITQGARSWICAVLQPWREAHDRLPHN